MSGNFLIPAMAADVIDYDELRTGRRREAQYMAFWALIPKFVAIPGSSVPLAILAAVGYVPNQVQTDEGGRAFTNLAEGDPLTLTVVKRNGREVTVEAVPEVPSTLAIAGGAGVDRGEVVAPRAAVAVAEPAPPEPRGVVAGVTPPVPPDRAEYPTPVLEPPEGFPLRYTWTQEGVEVEVRGEPVSVMEMRGARTLIINADGLWIRIRIPPGGEVPEIEAIRK